MSRARPIEIVPLALVAAAAVAAALVAAVPGWLSVDEGTYHWMTHALAEQGRLWLWNGYEETPSPELVAASVRVHRGRLAPMPPSLFAVLAAPFYRALGYRGLFVVNALAFAGCLALLPVLARQLYGHRRLGVEAALVFALATFAADYALASWPHMTATFFVLAALTATVTALEAPPGRRRTGWAAAAGVLVGLGTGVRLDVSFAAVAVLLPFLFARPPAWRAALAAVAGLVPGLAFLSWTNRMKFGTWAPLSYGASGEGTVTLEPYLVLAAAGAVLLVAAWIASRPAVAAWLLGRRVALLAAAALALLALAALEPLRAAVWRGLTGAWQVLVDLRVRDPAILEPAQARTAEGGVVYIGALKKALLQSCPWLAVLVPGAWLAVRGLPRERRAALLLALVPGVFAAVYGWFAWHGGLALNMRYLLPALPPAALAAVWSARRLLAGLGSEGWWAGGAAAAATCGLWLVLQPAAMPLAAQGLAAYRLPLVLAVLVLATGLAALASRWRRAAAAALGAAVTWAALTTFLYDLPRAQAHRAVHRASSERAVAVVEPDAVFFAAWPDPWFGLLEVDRMRLALATADSFRDFPALVSHHLGAGRAVYAAFPPPLWRRLAAAGVLDGLTGRPLLPGGEVVRLERSPALAPPAAIPPAAAPPGAPSAGASSAGGAPR